MPYIPEQKYTNFDDDKKKGEVGEQIFKEDFLDFLGIEYIDVTGCQQFQVVDTDFMAKIGKYEVKTNYKDNKILIFEDFTNTDESLGPISKGWMYKSTADLLVFISKKTKMMVLVPFTQKFKDHYDGIKEGFDLIQNQPSRKSGRRWRSAFRKIPLSAMDGYYSVYKRIKC